MKNVITIIIFLTTMYTALAQGIIDVHSHIVPKAYLSVLERHGALLEEGFPIPSWDVDEQLKWMDAAGVQTAVLTLPAPQPYFGDSKESSVIIRQTNEEAARIKKEHPGRFLWCATLPLPDVKAAVKEAIYALDTLHADGVKLATNARGQYLGTPELDTLMAILNERHAVVILHPHKPEPVNLTVMSQTPLAMQEYLSETTRTVANMCSRNVLARYPNLRVVVPHCGAYLPLAIPRMKMLAPIMQKNGMVEDIDWEKNLSALYYDLAGSHSPEVIRQLITITSPDHLLYGSDYPYVAPQMLTASINRMKEYLTAEPDLAPFRNMILKENARRLFRLTDEKPIIGHVNRDSMIVRIAEIEVYPEYLHEYLSAAKEVASTSLQKEPGVLCLYPCQLKEDGTQFRILEIYSSKEAYQHHIATAHFLKYKQGTLKMIKQLKLNDLTPLEKEISSDIFKRIISSLYF